MFEKNSTPLVIKVLDELCTSQISSPFLDVFFNFSSKKVMRSYINSSSFGMYFNAANTDCLHTC